MNEEIGYSLIDAELQRFRALPHSQLVALIGSNENKEVVGPDGKTYQLEMDVLWDGKSRDVRVLVSADDGRGWRSFVPLTRCFIKRPDGTFIDE